MAKLDLGEISPRKTLVLIFAFVIIVGAAGLLFDRLLIREGASRLDLMIASNALTGCVAGILLLQIVRRERERRAVIRERLQIVSEMNHHIRNALQVISFFVSREKDQETVEMVRSSVDRIQWALKEVLPGGQEIPRETWPAAPSKDVN
jgi:signal transduction histidine kinase